MIEITEKLPISQPGRLHRHSWLDRKVQQGARSVCSLRAAGIQRSAVVLKDMSGERYKWSEKALGLKVDYTHSRLSHGPLICFVFTPRL